MRQTDAVFIEQSCHRYYAIDIMPTYNYKILTNAEGDHVIHGSGDTNMRKWPIGIIDPTSYINTITFHFDHSDKRKEYLT